LTRFRTAFTSETSMAALFESRRHAGDADQRREYVRYLARQRAPMIHALMLVATLAYGMAAIVSTFIRDSALPLPLRLAPMLPLLLVTLVTRRVREPRHLSLLALLCVLLLESGINLNSIGHVQGASGVMPGLLLPVASSVIWLARWDFICAMALCALGPLPMLLLGHIDNTRVVQYLVYMFIAIVMSTVLRAFMARTLFAQFRLEQQLRERANTDDLTGLLLRNRFLELARRALHDLHQQHQPACLLYLDADHFKLLNDNHGHAAGDAALVALSRVLRGQARDTDLLARIGGEEFAQLLPGLDLAQACVRAELLRQAVRTIERPDGPLTISVGVAACHLPHERVEALLARADQAMRQAKCEGRDRVISSRHPAAERVI
jgi:diguanylate cyclase (GGDEF)-like protein